LAGILAGALVCILLCILVFLFNFRAGGGRELGSEGRQVAEALDADAEAPSGRDALACAVCGIQAEIPALVSADGNEAGNELGADAGRDGADFLEGLKLV
jgi:hypothetical protein